MPYTTSDAPVKNVLPKAALRLWVETFNRVLEETGDEDTARKAAWSNVKKAGYAKADDGKWRKAEGAESTEMEVGRLRFLDRAEAMALPKATLSKVYAEFKYASFGAPNENRDGFLAEDVTDEQVQTLIGSPIYLKEDASNHPIRDARATKRAQFFAGSIVFAEKREDGIYCIGAFQRETLEDRGIDPQRLDDAFSVSMEVTFDRTKAKYAAGGKTLTHQEAVAAGVASAVGTPDEPSKYDCRFIVPIDFHGTALLHRGRNADKTADILRVAAADDGILWAESDFSLMVATTAPDGSNGRGGGTIHSSDGGEMDDTDAVVLEAKERKRLPKGDFAYVDENGEGHLPIHDEEHVRNALARLNQTSISAAAKRKALRKIMRAANRMGVKVDKDSDVVKQYGGKHLGIEGRLHEIHEAFYDRFSPKSEPASYPYIRATYDDYVIAEVGDKTVKVNFKEKDDDIEFGDPVEVEVVYKPVKTTGADMSDAPKKLEMTQEEFDKAVQAKANELLEAKRAEIEAAAVEKAKADIEKAAVEAYKAHERLVADRVKELGDIQPIADAERADLEQKVREADETAYNKIKADRAVAALVAVRKDKAAADKAQPPAPALRGNPAGSDKRDPLDVRK